MSNYPKRSEQHITETDSITILRNILPHGWIFRELSEEDYGIDGIIEICDEGEVQGKVFAIQLKGHKYLSESTDTVNCYNIKPSTMNYWNNYPIPVIFLHISIENHKVYYSDIKMEIRKNYEEFEKGTFTKISIPQEDQLTKDNSEETLNALYYIETERLNFENNITGFVADYEIVMEKFNEFFRLDPGYGPEEDSVDWITFLNNHKRIVKLCPYFGIEKAEDLHNSFIETLKKTEEAFPNNESPLACPFLDSYIKIANDVMKLLLPEIIKLITDSKETYFWQKKNWFLFNYLFNLSTGELLSYKF